MGHRLRGWHRLRGAGGVGVPGAFGASKFHWLNWGGTSPVGRRGVSRGFRGVNVRNTSKAVFSSAAVRLSWR